MEVIPGRAAPRGWIHQLLEFGWLPKACVIAGSEEHAGAAGVQRAEMLDQGRLADPRFASEQNQAASTPGRASARQF